MEKAKTQSIGAIVAFICQLIIMLVPPFSLAICVTNSPVAVQHLFTIALANIRSTLHDTF